MFRILAIAALILGGIAIASPAVAQEGCEFHIRPSDNQVRVTCPGDHAGVGGVRAKPLETVEKVSRPLTRTEPNYNEPEPIAQPVQSQPAIIQQKVTQKVIISPPHTGSAGIR